MLQFPSYSFFGFGLSTLVIGLFLTSVVVYSWVKGKAEFYDSKVWITTVGALIFLLTGGFFSYLNFVETYSFRNIDVSQIKGFRVIKSADESHSDNSHQFTVNDVQSFREALISLKGCRLTSNNHEIYSDGYKIKLLFENESLDKDFFISVYRKSNGKSGKSVLMPHLTGSISINLGEYDCAVFQDWVRINIDPLFENKQ